MRAAGHRIEIHPQSKLMQVTLWGEWANAQTDGLIVDHAKAVARMKATGVEHGSFLTLVDMRDKMLSEEVTIVEFRRSFDADSPSRKTAIILPRHMSTAIADRIAPPARLLVTHDEQEARSWLFA